MSDVVRIKNIIDEAYDTKTFVFDWDAETRPGQFLMIWIPGVDEIPMSISGMRGNEKSITVKNIGEATDAIHKLRVGDPVRIRGPYGNGFDTSSNNILVIGGGVGTAAVMPLTEALGCDMIIAARSDRDVIMEERAKACSGKVMIATDDGSKGFHGNAVQLMKKAVAEKKYDWIAACGPEIMLFFTYKACEELDLQCELSMERYMKCGAGLCGCCVMDDARVCRDGPVFNRSQISQLTEFGQSKRDASGRLVKFR